MLKRGIVQQFISGLLASIRHPKTKNLHRRIGSRAENIRDLRECADLCDGLQE
jgi:hypothetical protein